MAKLTEVKAEVTYNLEGLTEEEAKWLRDVVGETSGIHSLSIYNALTAVLGRSARSTSTEPW